MSFPFDGSDELNLWAKETIPKVQEKYRNIFEHVDICVIWADPEDPTTAPIVPADPDRLVSIINESGIPLLFNHDPGRPQGQVVAAALFKTENDRRFVGAIRCFYTEETKLNFSNIGINEIPTGNSPKTLPSLPPETQLILAADPREVDDAFVSDLLKISPIKIKKQELSNNALEAASELVRVAVPSALLVWNPLVTTIGSELGKDLYFSVREYLKKLLKKSTALKNPIIVFQTQLIECEVSFIFRGNNIESNYKAHETLPKAVAQATALVSKINRWKSAADELVYEYDMGSDRWYPKFAILKDKSIVSDHIILIAIEQLPKGMSLGLVKR